MFSHIFKYEFKSCLRQKAILFWLIAFPIILGCFFKMAFSGIYEKDVVFNAIPVAVTNIEENDILKQVLEQISDSDEALFKVTYTDIDKAEEMLKSEDIKGIIISENRHFRDITAKIFIIQCKINTVSRQIVPI